MYINLRKTLNQIEKALLQEGVQDESKLQKALEAAKKMITDLTEELKAVKEELAQYKSICEKLKSTLEQENEQLKSELRQYKSVIERHNLWSFFSRHERPREQSPR